MELLKNNGLNRSTFGKCRRLAETISDDPEVKQTLLDWLKRHIAIKRRITRFPLAVSSDIIESLFGRFKHMLERNPQADMSRSALLIPVLCGTLSETTIRQTLGNAPHDALKEPVLSLSKHGSRKTFLIQCAKSVMNFSVVPSQKPGKRVLAIHRRFLQPRSLSDLIH